MSIFGSIVSKIFGHANAAPAPQAAPSSNATPSSAPTAPGGAAAAPAPSSFNNPAPSSTTPGDLSASSSAPTGSAAQTGGTAPTVDVGAVLTDLASKNGEKLDWKHSIVDLLKLLGLDSSLAARKELAKELNYTGSTDDSASMNIWLHSQVMKKLAENGGKVPDDLK